MTMINKEDFGTIKKNLDSFDIEREKIIKKSREIIHLSKKIIYSLHREDLNYAAKQIPNIKKEISKLKEVGLKTRGIEETGSFKVAVQEYVEAIAFFEFIKNKKLIENKQLNMNDEYYLMGICDLTGEVVRFAVNSAAKEKYDNALLSKEFVDQIYGEMLKFDFKGGELRRKFDSIKYDLKKLEDLVYELKLKGKI